MSWVAMEVNTDPFDKEKKEYHVYPKDEVLFHTLHGLGCWCCPRLHEDNLVISHSSFNLREITERIDDKLAKARLPLI